jgi:hypothetical protein
MQNAVFLGIGNNFVLHRRYIMSHVIFEVFTAVTMKTGTFWDITPCGSCRNRRFGGTGAYFIRVTGIGEIGTTLA